MKKGVLAAGIALVLVGVVLALTPRVRAQGPAPFARAPWALTLEGLGSSIGATVRDSDTEETRRAGTTGVVVREVREGTPAARAGLREGDIIVEFDGERARSARQFTRLVRETAAGRVVKITVVRDSARQTLDITPEARGPADLGSLPDVASDVQRRFRFAPRDFAFDFKFPELGAGPFSPTRLGVTVTPLTRQLADYFGVEQGVLVSEVEDDSPAKAAGIKAGDVITTINARAVATSADVLREMRAAGPGTSVEVRAMRDRREVTMTVKLPELRRPVDVAGRPV